MQGLVIQMDLFDNDDSIFGDNQSDNLFWDDTSQGSLFDDTDTQQSDMFNNTSDQDLGVDFDSQPQDTTQKKSVTKTALIAIAIGVVGLIVVLCIAGAVGKSKENENTSVQNNTNSSQVNINNNTNNNNVVVENNTTNTESSWVIISNTENVDFNTEYKNLTFLITGIEHYAKRVDAKGDLMLKTTLTGSLSGLSGVYTLDVPYNKGVKLSVGDEFTVQVLIGSYSGKSVVGDIVY